MPDDLDALAQKTAAEVFSVDERHITQAPRHCGDGYDGACSRGDCDIVSAVGIIRAAILAAVATLRRELDEAQEKLADWETRAALFPPDEVNASIRRDQAFAWRQRAEQAGMAQAELVECAHHLEVSPTTPGDVADAVLALQFRAEQAERERDKWKAEWQTAADEVVRSVTDNWRRTV